MAPVLDEIVQMVASCGSLMGADCGCQSGSDVVLDVDDKMVV